MKTEESKSRVISIKFTEQENTYLRAKAQEAGCNLSEYCRERLLQADTALPRKQAQNFYRQLCKHNVMMKDMMLSPEQKTAFEAWEIATWQYLK